jgi:hypothetical protein
VLICVYLWLNLICRIRQIRGCSYPSICVDPCQSVAETLSVVSVPIRGCSYPSICVDPCQSVAEALSVVSVPIRGCSYPSICVDPCQSVAEALSVLSVRSVAKPNLSDPCRSVAKILSVRSVATIGIHRERSEHSDAAHHTSAPPNQNPVRV